MISPNYSVVAYGALQTPFCGRMRHHTEISRRYPLGIFPQRHRALCGSQLRPTFYRSSSTPRRAFRRRFCSLQCAPFDASILPSSAISELSSPLPSASEANFVTVMGANQWCEQADKCVEVRVPCVSLRSTFRVASASGRIEANERCSIVLKVRSGNLQVCFPDQVAHQLRNQQINKQKTKRPALTRNTRSSPGMATRVVSADLPDQFFTLLPVGSNMHRPDLCCTVFCDKTKKQRVELHPVLTISLYIYISLSLSPS